MDKTTCTSIFLCYLLRHHPEAVGLELDYHGWADVEELINKVNDTKKYALTFGDLCEIVRTDNKQRYSFNIDKTMIRANQGHSVPVDVELAEIEPPDELYHGTCEKFTKSIEENGLIPNGRLYVHLSLDISTAVNVGARHGKSVAYKVNAGEMYKKGYRFYRSVNMVWLADFVPPEYLTREQKI